MNPTELFIFQMALMYANMVVQTNTKLTATQKAAVQNAITANTQVLEAFTNINVGV